MSEPKYDRTLCVSVTLDLVWLNIRVIFNDGVDEMNSFSNTTGNKATEESNIFVADQVVTNTAVGGVA